MMAAMRSSARKHSSIATLLCFLCCVGIGFAQTLTPTPTPTPFATATPTATPIGGSPTPTPSAAPTPSATPTASAAPTASATPTPSAIPTASVLPTPGGTATPTPASPGQLLNISTRALVQSGSQVLIGGFIVSGTDAKTVLLRAIGPSLTTHGVAGALIDPILSLFDETDNLVTQNDNWRDRSRVEGLFFHLCR